VDLPNILLVVVDCGRADRFSCNGYGKPTTPNVDSLAAEGVRFGAAYSESSWTVPAVFTLMTGLSPREHRAEVHRSLPPDLPTLAEALKRRGYETLCASANHYLGPETGLDRGFDWFFAASHPPLRLLLESLPKRLGWTDKGGDACTSACLLRLRQARAPWFAVVWYFDVHWPYIAKRPFTRRFCDRPVPLGIGFSLRNVYEYGALASEEKKAVANGLYDGCIAYDDMLIGRLRDGLQQMGFWDEAVAIVTADHGEMLGEGRLMGHGPAVGLDQPLLQVPLVVRAPRGLVEPGVSTAPVQLADATRTIASLAGATDALAPTAATGADLFAAARGHGRPRTISERFELDAVSAEHVRQRHPHFDLEPYLCDMTAVVEDGWKLVHRASGRHDLYHLAADPHEQRNLIDEEPARAAALAQVVYDWARDAVPHPAVESLLADPGSAVKRRLQDLGYFG